MRPSEPSGLDIEDYLEHAPCGLVFARPDGRIVNANITLATWLGHPRNQLLGKHFPELLTVGGRMHYETHFAPLLQIQGHISGVAVELVGSDNGRIPALLSANVQADDAGAVVGWRIALQDARDRRSYERELLAERQRADRERARAHELAATLQRSLVPPMLHPPGGLAAAAYYHPASTDDVGGDFYDLFPIAGTKWGFFLGDVSGKGAGAAAVTSLARYTLRAAAVYDAEPSAVLHNLNTVLGHEFHGDDPRFCTVIFGVLSPRGDGFTVDLAAGGHPPALLLTADGAARYVHTAGGQAVGLVSSPHFVSARLTLSAGDTLVLYTDRLTEARVGRVRRHDDDNALLEFAGAHSPTTASDIVDEIQRLLDGFGPGLDDDTAVMALGVPAAMPS